jgi:SAM-dependent methyltransferase
MISTWSQGPVDANMPEAMLTDTLERVRRHPWWLARAKLALAVLKKHGLSPPASVADVGCGWGVNLEALEAAGYRVVGLDISRRVLELIDRPSRRLIEADINQPLPAHHESHDALLALDVIEHLDDDRGAVNRLAGLLRPGGLAVLSVPALPELFSEFDRIQGHRRRYVPETLRAAFAGSGLAVRETFWWGAWMVPVLRRMRRQQGRGSLTNSTTYADYLRLPPWPAAPVMKLMYSWEKGRTLRGRLRIGTSLFAVAKQENGKGQNS